MEQCRHDEEIIEVAFEARPSLILGRFTCLFKKHCGQPMKRTMETVTKRCKKCGNEKIDVIKTVSCAKCNWHYSTNLTWPPLISGALRREL